MDFIVGLPKTSKRYDSIWVIVDRLTKSAHFLPVKTIYTAKQYAQLYMDRIVSLHGIPKTIISDRGAQFIARFWEHFHAALGTQLIRSSAYHPRPMVKLRELIKFWKICCGPVYSLIVKSGMSVYHSLNFLTIIATRKVSRWHLLKPYMDEDVGLH